MPCPNAETLSMYLDGELQPAARQALEDHLATCQHCAQKLQRWEAVQPALGEAFRRRMGSRGAATGRPCAHQAELPSYASGLLTPREQAALEEHLQSCDPCLSQVMGLRHTLNLLQQDRWLAPPEQLVRRARRAIVGNVSSTGIMETARVVIQMARAGLKILESSCFPPALDLLVAPLPSPTTAFRTQPGEDEMSQAVEIRHIVGECELYITLVHADREAVWGSIRAQKQGTPLARARVTLRRAGKTVYSRNLSPEGQVNIPQLTPGEYTISVPQERVETTVILQASIEE